VARVSARTSGATANVRQIDPSREVHDLYGPRCITQHPRAWEAGGKCHHADQSYLLSVQHILWGIR
jgi:hypothetical protein